MSHTKRSTSHLSDREVRLAYERGHYQVSRAGVGKVAGNRAVTNSHDDVLGDTRWAKRAQAKMVRRNAANVIREQAE